MIIKVLLTLIVEVYALMHILYINYIIVYNNNEFKKKTYV